MSLDCLSCLSTLSCTNHGILHPGRRGRRWRTLVVMRATAISNRGVIGCDAIRGSFVEAVLLVPRAG